MGKGDKKTKRGKIFSGSFGKSRPHRKNKSVGAASGSETKSTKPAKK